MNKIKISWRGNELEFPEHEVPKWAEDYVKRTYLLRDDKGNPCEELKDAFIRVTGFVGDDDRLDAETQDALILLMRAGVFYPNVVFFINAGTSVKNLAPCYSISLEDTMESITANVNLAMEIQTKGGGLGIDFTPLRAKGSLVGSNKGEASGPCNFIHLFNAITDTIKAGGRRRGANLGVLDWCHPDIKEFVTLKDNPQELENFNLSVRVDDEFMGNVQSNVGLARDLFHLICVQAWKTGDPGMLFDEALNRDNPQPGLGKITNSNPCGEVLAPSPFACNLASIDVSKFVASDGGFDWESFHVVVELGCLFLNAALDAGCYVGELIRSRMKNMRLVGLGIMGFADLLLKLKIRYGDDGTLWWACEIGSNMMVKTEEVLPSSGIHLAFAPTGSLAALAGCSSGIEPNFAWKYTRKILTTGEEVSVVHPLAKAVLPDLQATLPDYFVTAHEVSPEDHVKVAAEFQKYVDGGVSKTVNLSHDATVEDVKKVFLLAWKLGCKGITVFRDGCRDEQMLEVVGETATEAPSGAGRRRLPETRPGVNHKFNVGGQEGYIHPGAYEDGSLGEIFTNVAKTGTLTRGLMDCFSIAISLCLQHGVSLEVLVEKFSHQRFEPSGATASKEIPFATSIVDYIFRWLNIHYGGVEGIVAPEEIVSGTFYGDTCPECGSQLIYESNCAHCTACGYNKCG